MSAYSNKLIAAGLPVYSGDETHVTYSRSLTAAEEITAAAIEREMFPERYPTEQVFPLPLRAPTMTAEQFVESHEYYLMSAKAQKTKDLALAKVAELDVMERKALGEIVRNLAFIVKEQDTEIKELKAKVK